MAQNIPNEQQIDIVINVAGGAQSVKTVGELRKAIDEIKSAILGLSGENIDIVDPQTKELIEGLKQDLKAAQTELDNVGKKAQQTTQQTTQAIQSWIRLGGALTTGFAAARSTFALFGAEGEELNKAAIKAQNLLTISLAASAIAQEAATLKKIKDTAVTYANIVAQQGLIAALRTLWATMLANPLTAILALLGAVISLLVIFADSTDKAAEAEERFQKQLEKTNTTRQRTIELLEAQGASEETLYQTKLKFALQAQNDANAALQTAIRRGDKEEYIEKRKQELEEATHNNRVLNAQYQTYLRNKAEKEEEENSKKAKDRYNKEIERINKVIEALNKRNEELVKFIGIIAPLTEYETDLNKSLDENVKTTEAYSDKLDELVSVTERYAKLQNQLIQQNDYFGDQLTDLRGVAEGYFNAFSNGEISLDTALRGIQGTFYAFQKNNYNSLTLAQRALVQQYKQAYIEVLKVFRQIDGIEPEFDYKAWEKAIIDLSLVTGKISLDPFERTPEQREGDKLTAQKRVDDIQNAFVEAYIKKNIETQKLIAAQEAKIPVSKLGKEQIDSIVASLEAQGKTIFQTLTESTQGVIVFENGIDKVANTTEELNTKLKELSVTAREGFLLENAEELTNYFQLDIPSIEANREKLTQLEEEITSKRFDTQKTYQDDVNDLEAYYLNLGIDLSEISYEAKLVLLKEYLNLEVEAVEEAEDKKQKKQKETTDKILNTIQEFKSALTSISQTVADFYSAQLDNLERENESITEKIVGDNEEAVKKRLEQEKIYQTKKKELEKKATISSLRFSQVQAVANIAEAITKALTAGPIAGQIAAGITAAMGVVQIGIIQSQIASAQTYQRGGIIKGMGGLLVGPSHEYGGIRYGAQGLELEGGEAVINRNSRLRYSELLNQININGGGRPLVQNNFDDSRIVEAIAKQRQEPIRAYVVESDITNKQAVSKRLERLSQF